MDAPQISLRSEFTFPVAAGIALLGFSAHTVFAAETGREPTLDEVQNSRPNIIFILADDMGYNDLSFTGQAGFETPGLDQMAKEGIFLTDHYASSTVSAPSRATLLTGQHTGHVYQGGNGEIEFRLDPLDITIATRLQRAGYHTAMIGKSGVGCNSTNATLPKDKGFDHFFGFLAHAAAHRFYPERLYKNRSTISYPLNHGHTGEIYNGDLFLDDALCYINTQGQTGQPFCLHLASTHNSNAPFRGGKHDFCDGGIRVPSIAWWPGTVPSGTKSDHISAFWDFPPTALELAGKPVPEKMDGISFLPPLIGKPNEQQEHEYLYWEFYEQGGKQAIRYGEWKGIRLNVKRDRHGLIELYNIVEDPGETTDIADQHPDLVEKVAFFMEEAHETPEFEGFSFE